MRQECLGLAQNPRRAPIRSSWMARTWDRDTKRGVYLGYFHSQREACEAVLAYHRKQRDIARAARKAKAAR